MPNHKTHDLDPDLLREPMPRYEQAMAILAPLRDGIRVEGVPREQNREADARFKQELSGR